MDTIFMNSRTCKTADLHGLLLNLNKFKKLFYQILASAIRGKV